MSFSIQELLQQRLVSIFRIESKTAALQLAELCAEAGLFTNEVTLTTPGALEVVASIKKRFGDKIAMGAGTILNPEQCKSACDAGADFLVTPNLNLEVIAAAQKLDMPIMPGCFTPSEMQTAFEAGAAAVKLFPVSSLSAQFIKAVLAPLPHLKIIAVGGVQTENARSYLDAGAAGVGVGTQAFGNDDISTPQGRAALTKRVKKLITLTSSR
jgi:2-dehydro-3-deoxyphosphogluconate aldolase / (4S)-4-hydroxy-2-oxoglutarate aldolase